VEGSYISLISIPVLNPDAAKAFYTDVLGFEVASDLADTRMRWVMLRPPGGGPSITLVTWFETMLPGSLRGTVLAVPDIEAAVADLRAKGAIDDDEQIQSAPWGRWVNVEDPDGNGWVVQQNTETTT
jgi:catechol 2,3-dioxygenase-like lactoylglutathione lyase family enzyme